MDKNLAESAGDPGSIPGPGRLHMPQSNSAPIPQLLKPMCLESVLLNERCHRHGKAVSPNWRGALTLCN